MLGQTRHSSAVLPRSASLASIAKSRLSVTQADSFQHPVFGLSAVAKSMAVVGGGKLKVSGLA